MNKARQQAYAMQHLSRIAQRTLRPSHEVSVSVSGNKRSLYVCQEAAGASGSRGAEGDAAGEVQQAQQQGVKRPAVRRAGALRDGAEVHLVRHARQVDAEAKQAHGVAALQRQQEPVQAAAEGRVAGEGAQAQAVKVAPQHRVRLHLPVEHVGREEVHPVLWELARQRGAVRHQRVVPQQEGLPRGRPETRPAAGAAPQRLQLEGVLLVEDAEGGAPPGEGRVLSVIGGYDFIKRERLARDVSVRAALLGAQWRWRWRHGVIAQHTVGAVWVQAVKAQHVVEAEHRLVRIYRRSVARGRHHTGAVAHHRAGREAPRSDRIPVGDGQVEGHCLVRIAGLQVAHGGVDGARHAVGEQAGQRLAQLTQARQR
mmetsp:Transcript_2541/g.6311  ORF Transcript_2541/g.6311 Transcript_2541/m.6311 type:complete len:369 (-) Transcript_2541:411-1517(-)